MTQRILIFLATLIVLCPAAARGQDAGGSVEVHRDPRLDVLATYMLHAHSKEGQKPQTQSAESQPGTVAHKAAVILYSGRGYRVQIYSGSDRNRASKIKTEFMRGHPGVHAYLSFTSPSFRVKVGDYRTRKEAEAMLREIAATYQPSMVVPDDITIIGVQ